MKKRIILILLSVIVFSACRTNDELLQTRTLQELKRDFIDLRFGMFICYNIMSYGAVWGEANYPIESFNPVQLDCGQWAKAAKSAGMKFGLLTTKHHEGFCLWDSEFTDYDVASTPYKKDIVQQYVDSFRKEGLRVGLYYSIWDSSNGIDKGKITPEKMEFIKGQITELLSNYGEVDYFVMDGWFWRMGHHEVPYDEIREHIRSLQPNCLITDHTHLQAPYHMEIPYFEGPFGAYPPEDNIMASALGHCSVKGNGWFWSEKTPNGIKQNDGIDTIVSKLNSCEDRYCNFMLNCMPNRDGLLDELFVELLAEIGEKWNANEQRPTLPTQAIQVYKSVPIRNAKATSGDALNLFSGTKIPGGSYYFWESDSVLPQEFTIDLGESKEHINTLLLVGNHRCKPGPESALARGNITKCKVYISNNDVDYRLVSKNIFEANAKYRSITFETEQCRYLKVEVLEAIGGRAIISEVDVGSSE